MFERH